MDSSPDSLLALGQKARRERRLSDARTHFSAAIEHYRQQNDPHLLAQAFTGLGQIERDLHNADAALTHYRDAVAIYRTLPEPLLLGHTVRHVGDILEDMGKHDLAEPCYKEALDIYRSHPSAPKLDLANTLRGYALLKGATGHAEDASAMWQEARALYMETSVHAGVTESDRQIARLAKP